jgi:hypothetical protein
MPQNTNLNTTPYYDDFNEDDNFKRVLFKPGTAIQSRELTTLQSILQNQIEKFGQYFFKEGAKVIPGQTSYDNQLEYVKLDPTFFGVNLRDYIELLVDQTIIGEISGVTAKVLKVITDVESDGNSNTLYIKYIKGNSTDFRDSKFTDGERLIVESTITNDNITIQSGNSFATCVSSSATGTASSASISDGIYFLRGHFVKVLNETIILDQYSNTPSNRVGLLISEEFITAYDDSSLYDNAQGYSNFSAPGADRFKISTNLIKKGLEDFNDENFIELMRIIDGVLQVFPKENISDNIRDELARRTYDESGDYIVEPFELFAKESLNDLQGNGGIYNSSQKTSEGRTPDENLAIIQVSPGKAYVRGYDIAKINSTFVDIEKPRTSNTVDSFSLSFNSTNKVIVNNVFGSPPVGLGTTTIIKLIDSRIGSSGYVAGGNEIGVARLYDYKLENSKYSDPTTTAEAYLYDIQTYTKVSLSSNVTLSTPAHIRGNSSGAVGYLQSTVSNTPNLVLYCTNGSFLLGESVSVNGISSTPTISSIRDYDLTDVKSLYTRVGINTFNADLLLNTPKYLAPQGTQFTYTNGTVTVGITSAASVGIKTGDIIKYTRSGFTTSTYNKVTAVSPQLNTFTVTGVSTVSGVCDGQASTSTFTINDLTIVSSSLYNANKSALINPLPNQDISGINLDSSTIKIRKTYTTTASGNQVSITETDNNLFFVNFDVEDYLLTYSDGTVEPLTSGNLILTNGGKTITFIQLSKASDSSVKVIATLDKIKTSSKQKFLNRCATVTISRSSLTQSGIGTSSLNDGLTFSSIYGTRVQDPEISLNVPDVLRVQGVFESSDTSSPTLPNVTLTEISGNLLNAIVGDLVIGNSSNACARLISTTPSSITFAYQTENTFKRDETLYLKKSGITGRILTVSDGDNNISDQFELDNGQRLEYLDYSRIVRKKTSSAPSKSITIVFDYYSIPSGDTGDFISFSSYSSDQYTRDIPTIKNVRSTDAIDIRPRVSVYNPSSNTLSPFEFNTRSFVSTGTYANYPILTNSQIILGYSYYLPRIDILMLTKDGFFELRKGVPSDNPKPPIDISTSLNIATIKLSPFGYDAKTGIKISPIEHKRYRMSDITKLETRLSNVETYTSLSLLESDTSNLSIKDASTGLDRFKSGFFVDNFKNHSGHILRNSSIDSMRGELRPSHYTTALDLLIGSESLIGIGTTSNPNADIQYVADLQSPNIRKTGEIITLNYTETVAIQQKFATRTENLNPFAVSTWIGTLKLNPESDTWMSEKKLDIRNIQEEGNYNQLLTLTNADPNTGFSPVDWGAWEETWSGTRVLNTELVRSDTVRGTTPISDTGFVRTGTRQEDWPFILAVRTQTFSDTVNNLFLQTSQVDQKLSRTGVQFQVSQKIDQRSLGSSIVSREIIPYCRSRNIEFTAKKLKPRTRFYAFFDNVIMTNYCIPKLLEISMTHGVFQTGETVVGYVAGSTVRNTQNSLIRFRVAQLNHKYGPYNSATETYQTSPYSDTVTLGSSYSATSQILNVDTYSLQIQSESSFYGYVGKDVILVGQTSGAQAIITDLRLVSNESGTLIASIYLPDPNLANTPKFQTGKKTLLLTADETNNPLPGSYTSQAQSTFTASGELNITQETVISTRNATIQRQQTTDTTTRSSVVTTTSRTTTNQTRTEKTQAWVDPLAETILVTDNGGIFVTSLDIYFATKDTSIPVTCQIRTTQTGIPGAEIIPFSETTIEASQVRVSNDATIPTKFTFSSPVFLEGSREYAIVLLSDSNNYTAWISRMGEEDISTRNLAETQKIIVSQQPYLGVLFKSQNGSTWDSSQLEDLKFTLYKAKFVQTPGVLKLYNPKLGVGNNQIPQLRPNPLNVLSKEVRVGLGSTVSTTFLNPGTNITQLNNLNAIGKITKTAGAIQINNTSALTTNNVGSGLTPSTGNFTFTGVNLTSVTGVGTGAQIQISINSGAIGVVTVTSGGYGYAVGDVVTARIGSLSQNVRFNVGIVSATNFLILDNVQGNFDTTNQIAWIVPSGPNVGIASTLPGAIPTNITSLPDRNGLYVKVNHRNHGMHSRNNKVTISNAIGDKPITNLALNYLNSSTTNISLNSVGIFTSFENVGVSSTNPGYIRINNEILSYTGTDLVSNPPRLTGIGRGIDSTIPQTHSINDVVMKYELGGISLRRINTTHNFVDVDVANEITLDSYYIKVNTTSTGIGTARDGTNGLPILGAESSTFGGGSGVRATQNIQFETITPNVQLSVPTNTEISTRIRTVTSTSVDGTEISFNDVGYEPINLNSINNLNSPRIICSQVNETDKLSNLPGNKSFTMEMTLSSFSPNLSPAIDLDRINIITTSNRIDRPIIDFINDSRVNLDQIDPSSATYVTKRINLENPATSIDVRFAAVRNLSNDIRVLYKIFRADSPDGDQPYILFPGYNKLGDGTSDSIVATSKIDEFLDYRYTVDNLSPFNGFVIKLIMVGTNQASVPRIKEFRAIALA